MYGAKSNKQQQIAKIKKSLNIPMSCWIIRNLKNSNDSKIVKYYLIIDNNIIQTLKLLSIFMFNQKLHPVMHTYLSDCITGNDKDDLMN